jgi:hypothetical protein
VSVTAADVSPGELSRGCGSLTPPVFVRVHKGQVLLDPRTLLEGEESIVVESLVTA